MKITLTELRNLVKNIIREEVSKEKPVKKSEEEKEQERIITKIKKMIAEINPLINEVNVMIKKSEIVQGVVDTSGTWQAPYIYEPIIFDEDEGLIIVDTDVSNGTKKTEEIPLSRLHNDGVAELMLIRKMYNSAKRKLQNEK